MRTASSNDLLAPYLPRIAIEWFRDAPDELVWEVEGSLAFVDISGFTKLSERLSRRGKVGAELLTEALDASFTSLLAVAYEKGGGLLKFGGDALLLLFSGPGHEARACRSAYEMRRLLREISRTGTSGITAPLRMSVGVNTGTFLFFLVGKSHRELVVTGPAATQTVRMESAATAGEILLSGSTAGALPKSTLGEPRGDAVLLRSEPPPAPGEVLIPTPPTEGLDIEQGIPVAIREHLSGAPEPEHRQATVAFIHFDGADRLLERSGPQALAEELDALIGDVQRATEAHGVTFLGTDISSNGGKIILVTGVPRASGDHEERMLLALRGVIGRRGDLTIRAGVNLGHVFAGDVGPPYRRTYTVMGDAVNLAARLMAAAQPGQILATGPVLDRSRTSFATTALEPLRVKGKARPVQAYVVGEARRALSSAGHDLPLVGRDDELGVLLDALESARNHHGRAIEILGDPGIGKSRLVREARARAADLTVMTVTCQPYESSTPYAPFREFLRGLPGLGSSKDPAVANRRLVERCGPNAPQLVPWLPLLGAVLDIELPPTPETEALDPQFLPDRLADVLVGFLGAIQATPALFVFEDVHWMDEASTPLLQRLVQSAPDHPWVILTTRRYIPGGFIAPADVERLALEPLESAEAITLLDAATEDDPLPAHQLTAAAERSAGNPLFVLELLAALRSGGSADALPDSVESLISSRIDSLAARDRTLLRYASVLGPTFEGRLLAEVLGGDVPSPDDQVWATLADFIAWTDPQTLRFRQTLVRDVAYEGLPYRRRRELHGRVGDAILATSGEAAEEQSEVLALHFVQGERHQEAWRFARLAGERARAKYANVEASEFYERAIFSAKKLAEVALEEVAAVSEALGDVRYRVGEFRRAHVAFAEARRLAQDQVVQARLFLKESLISERLGRYSEALRWTHRGHRVAEDAEGVEAARQRAALSGRYAALRQAQGRASEAIKWCRRAIEEARAAGDLKELAHAYFILDWANISLGRADEERHSWEALRIYEELGDLSGQAVVLNNLGVSAFVEGRWMDAIDLYERGREARERTGDPVNAAYGTYNIGEILSDQGRLDEAEKLFRQALRVWRAAGDRSGVAYVESQLGRIAVRAGRFEEALLLLSHAGAEFLDVGDRGGAIETSARAAECRLLQGDSEAALATANETLSLADAMGSANLPGGGVPLLHRLRGYALMQLGRLDEARQAVEESLAMAQARNAEYEVALSLHARAQLARLQGDTLPEAERESARILQALGVAALPSVPGVPDLDFRTA